MWQFLSKACQILLSHEFGSEQLVRLITVHIRREEERAIGHQPLELAPQRLETVALQRRDRNVYGEVPLPRSSELPEEIRIRCLIGLVHGDDHRSVRFGESLCDQPIAGPYRLAGIEEEQHGIGLCDGPVDELVQPLAQDVAGLVKTRSVHKHQLSLAVRSDAADRVASGLRPGRRDRHLLTDEGVDQR